MLLALLSFYKIQIFVVGEYSSAWVWVWVCVSAAYDVDVAVGLHLEGARSELDMIV